MVKESNDLITIKPHKLGWREKIFFLISGIVVSIPITIFLSALSRGLYDFLPLFYTQVISIVLFAPFIEEFSKAYPLFYRYSLSERSIVILGFLVGLGFGITEFLLYVFVYGAPFYVRLPAVIFHAASTSLVAYGIARNKAVQYYLLAVFLHLGANLMAVIDQVIPVIVITVFTYFLSWITYRKTTDRYLEPE
ncbi:MAG: PrsW family intramembrane metalloprotease [Methanobacterium sp.]|jgi:RsiW-degrading membrane proteinase PrsW (M82 family)|nr:PrsW family intramembrane metalloprotease [Methanobacterium sp.]